MSHDEPRYGSDVMADVIRSLGIRLVALNPGSSYRGLHDSLVNYAGDSFEIVTCPHEKVAVGLAHGYAKATGEMMAVVLHDLVGLLHGTMGIYYAYIDRCPVLVLGGAGPMDASRRRPNIDWIHTANIQGNAVRDYTKWDDQPFSLAAVPASLARARRVAMSEPRGPVYVALDAGLQEDELSEPPDVDLTRFEVPSSAGPDPRALDDLARRLVDSNAAVMIPGYAGRDDRAFDQLVELTELLSIGVIDTHIRPNFPNRHPLNVTGSDELTRADCVLFVDVKDMGKWTQKLDSTTRVMHSLIPEGAAVLDLGFNDVGIGAWSHDFAALHPTDVQVTADSAVALPLLLDRCRSLVAGETGSRRQQRKERALHLTDVHERVWAGWRAEADAVWDHEPVSTARLAGEVWEAIRLHDWVLAAGTAAGWAHRTWDFDRPYRHPGRSLGTATQISIALGVALAHRGSGKLVVDLQPDGDLMFDLGALWIASHDRIPLLVVMFNNRGYYNDWEHQIRMAKYRGTEMDRTRVGTAIDGPAPDFAGAARSLGWYAEGPFERAEEAGAAIARAATVVLEEGAPALVDVVCSPR